MATSTSKPACAPRKSFKTRESAQAAAVSIAARHNTHRIPEPCPHCNGWHLR